MDGPTSRAQSNTRIEGGDGKTKLHFSSTLTAVVTLLGYSIGTSDFWRLPFLAYRNGGGAFLVPFCLTIVLAGIPLFFLEYAISKFSGKGVYSVWDIAPLFRGTAFSCAIVYGIYSAYLSVFRCWLFEFFINSFQSPLPWSSCLNSWNSKTCFAVETNGLLSHHNNTTAGWLIHENISAVSGTVVMSAAEEFWQYHVLDLSNGIDDFGGFQWKYALYNLAGRIIVVLCCYKSIKSIEKVMFVLMFGPLLLVTVIFIRSLMLPGALDGVQHFFEPDFGKLAEPRVWIESSLMAFYTIGVGWGAVVMIGSNSSFHENSLRITSVLPILDAGAALYFAMVCFSVLGNMAHSTGAPINEVVHAGMSVGVVAYPNALAHLPLPQVWSVIFFSAVLLQGLDTQIISVETILQVLGETFPNLFPKRRTAVLILVNVLYLLVGMPLCTKAGGYIFLFLDWYVGIFLGPVVTLIELFVVGWIYGGDRFDRDMTLLLGRPLPAILRILIAFVTPIIVLILLFASILQYVPPNYGDYVYPVWAQGVGWVIVVATLSPILLHVLRITVTGKGTVLQKIKRQLRPTPDWQPVEDDLINTYNRSYMKRTKTDVLAFNAFGKYRNSKLLQKRQQIPLVENI